MIFRSFSSPADGSVVAIGAPGNDNGRGVRLSNHGREQGRMEKPQKIKQDGHRLLQTVLPVEGTHGNNGNGDDSGHVRVYQNNNGSWVQIGDDIMEKPQVIRLFSQPFCRWLYSSHGDL